jgi:streptogramin lyase
MSVDTRGRRAAQALVQAAERLGPVPSLDRLRRRRRRRSAARAGLAFAAVLVAAALVGRGLPVLERLGPEPADRVGSPPGTRAWPGVPGLDRHVRDAVATGKAVRADVAAGPSGVWVLNRSTSAAPELVRVDPATDKVVARIDAGFGATRLAVGEDGAVWLYRAGKAMDRPELVRVDPATNRVADVVALPPPREVPTDATALLAVRGSVWVASQEDRLLRLDPASRTFQELRVSGRTVAAEHLAFAGGWVWTAGGLTLQRIDPGTGGLTMTVSDPGLHNAMPATGLAGGAGGLWMYGVSGTGEQLFRLDLATGRPLAMRQLGSRTNLEVLGVLAAGDRTVAVRSGTSLQLADPAGTLGARFPVPGPRGGLAVGSGAVWVADPARGRLLRVDPAA